MLGFMTSGARSTCVRRTCQFFSFLDGSDQPLPWEEDVVRKITEFLTFLRLKGQ